MNLWKSRLLRFNQTASDVFRKWYVDGRMYFHLLVDPKKPKKRYRWVKNDRPYSN